MLRSGAELAGVELVGGSDLGKGSGRQMESGRNGRCVYGRGWREEEQDPSREQGAARERTVSVLRAEARSVQTPSERDADGGVPRVGDTGGFSSGRRGDPPVALPINLTTLQTKLPMLAD